VSSFLLYNGSTFILRIKQALIQDFYELDYIELLGQVDFWFKINLQAMAIYLKGITCIILDGDGPMSWSVDDLERSIPPAS
jgi:hypothetical protein